MKFTWKQTKKLTLSLLATCVMAAPAVFASSLPPSYDVRGVAVATTCDNLEFQTPYSFPPYAYASAPVPDRSYKGCITFPSDHTSRIDDCKVLDGPYNDTYKLTLTHKKAGVITSEIYSGINFNEDSSFSFDNWKLVIIGDPRWPDTFTVNCPGTITYVKAPHFVPPNS